MTIVITRLAPFLLLFLAAGCRTAAVPPGLSDETPGPEELRLYEVADLLGQFGSVPKQGCCVLPVPETYEVVFPRSWSVSDVAALLESVERPVPGSPPGGVQAGDAEALSPAERTALLEMTVRTLQDSPNRPGPPVRAASRVRSPLMEEPDAALLRHIRSRLAAQDRGPVACRLSVRGGTTLEAQGSPGALMVVEGALAELR